MTFAPKTIAEGETGFPQMPRWALSRAFSSVEDAAFISGAALGHLHALLGREDVPQALLRDKLALKASETALTHLGRPERSSDLRDAVHFLQPGDSPGPAGEIYLSWQTVVTRPLSHASLEAAMPMFDAGAVAMAMKQRCDGAMGCAADALEQILIDHPRALPQALMLADAVLASQLGWKNVLPLLALGLKRSDLQLSGQDLRLACHRAAVASAVVVSQDAADLSRRAGRLLSVVSKLRAKGAAGAVDLVRSRDAIAPTALVSLRSGRAARRFCDRLVSLGVVRELTGRDTFRLYGL